MSSAGVLSRWHRSDCLIRSHSCTVPEPLSSLLSSSSLCFHSLLSLSVSYSPSLCLPLYLFDFFWSPPPHSITFSLPFNFNSRRPTLPFFLPFSACWLCNSAAKADWQGDDWDDGDWLKFNTAGPVEAKGWPGPLLIAWTTVLSPCFNYRRLPTLNENGKTVILCDVWVVMTSP